MVMLSDHLRNTAASIRAGHPCTDGGLLDRAADLIERLSNDHPATETVPGLTPRQLDLMRFIQHSFDTNGYAPSLDEMSDALDFSTRSNAHRLLGGLIERGYIAKVPDRPRALTILKRVNDQSEPAPATLRTVASARKDGGVAAHTPPSINPRTSDLSPGDCGHRTEDKGSDEAAPVRVAEGPGTAPVNSSRPAENFEPGALTAAGPDGEGDGAHTPPRTPEPVISMTSTDHARSGGLHVEGEPDLPAFLDRRGHG